MSSPNYRRVSSAEATAMEQEHANANTSTASSSNSSRGGGNSRRSLSERFSDKLWALGWVTVAALTAYATNFWTVILLLEDETSLAASMTQHFPNRSLLQVVALLFGIQTILVLYLTVYLPRVKGLTDSSAWEVYCPRVIPFMTVTGIVAGLLLIRATWPVWGFLSPLILGVQAMGCLFALHFLPWPF
jgi:hypothetical protein